MPTLPGQVTGTASVPVAVRFQRRTVAGPNGCLLWTGAAHPFGYGELTVAGKRTGAHRVAYEMEHGPIPAGMSVLHRCDTPACVNPVHLFLGTQADNMADKVAKGRAASRSRNGAARLTDEQYAEIERRVAGGEQQATLAREFGISPQAVCQYLKRRALVTG